MDHNVRITADGGCKVRIVGKRESKMPDIFCRVDGFCHGADGRCFYKMFFWFSFNLLKEYVQILRRNFSATDREVITNSTNEYSQLFYFLRIGNIMNTVDERRLTCG